MIRPDVIDLRAFYRSPLGLTARRLVRTRIREIWPRLDAMRVLGLGFATPYLSRFRDQAERVVAAMPTSQGVIYWPTGEPALVTLVDDHELPFPDAFFDRVLVVHGIETAENIRGMLREIWRVLAPSGRVLMVVPNRVGLWARFENSPFGHGQPYAPPQLVRLMRDTLFSPTQVSHALHMPPSEARWVLGAATTWERLGQRFWPRFSGAVLLEAEKQIYAASTAAGTQRRRALTWRPLAGASDPAPTFTAPLGHAFSAATTDRPPARPRD